MDPEDWRKLYVAKLHACYQYADFTDSKKDTELKDQKKGLRTYLITQGYSSNNIEKVLKAYNKQS